MWIDKNPESGSVALHSHPTPSRGTVNRLTLTALIGIFNREESLSFAEDEMGGTSGSPSLGFVIREKKRFFFLSKGKKTLCKVGNERNIASKVILPAAIGVNSGQRIALLRSGP